MNKLFIILVIGAIILSSCEETHIPKPKGYHKIDLPEHKYLKLGDNLPYSFEHSSFAITQPHKKTANLEPNWIDIIYPEFGASVELTYKEIEEDGEQFNKMLNDSRKLTNKHNIKAYAIDETTIKTPLGLTANVFELEGDVPSQFQFYVTDTTNHFFRGALYFKTSQKNDSLKPVIEYITYDIIHMLNTLEWETKQP